jgi:hypothetical protein
MSRTEIVTSFSASGAARYGRRCVDSLASYWPHPVTVYADERIDLDGVTVRLTSSIPDWCATRDRLPSTREDAPVTGSDTWTRKVTSFLWNAQRFAVKPFVWYEAALRLEQGLLVWLDGDTVTTRPVPSTLAATVLGDADVAYLGRGAMHPETGVVVFRIPEAMPLLRWCRESYQFGACLSMADGWTDCHVLRAGLAAVSVNARDLTSHACDEWRSGVDAFAVSAFGPYVQHLKGGRKWEAAA